MMTLEEAQTKGIAPWDLMTVDLDTVKIFKDRYPVTIGHRLFVPRTDSQEHIFECFQQAYKYGDAMVRSGGCDSFNVGMNVGASAGQTVMYPHVHCIPRRKGDCEDPTGGVRGVISHQQNYRSALYKSPNDT